MLHTKGVPNEALLRELQQVAEDANSTLVSISKANQVSEGFPKDSLQDLCVSLAGLSAGTDGNCRPILEYARSKIPAIRRENFRHDDPMQDGNAEDSLTRGLGIDRELAALLLSVGTALEEYRAQSQEHISDEINFEPTIELPVTVTESAMARSNTIVATAQAAREDIVEEGWDKFEEAQVLSRRLKDSENLAQAGKSLFGSKRVGIYSLNKIASALSYLPKLIEQSGKALKKVADVGDELAGWWSKTEHNIVLAINNQIRGFGELLERISAHLDSGVSTNTTSSNNKNVPSGAQETEASEREKQLIAALYSRLDENKSFAEDVSRGIVSPVSNLRSSIETLRADEIDNTRVDLANSIEEEVQSIERLISELQSVGTLDAELNTEAPKRFDIVGTVKDVSKGFGNRAEEEGVEFITDLPSDPIFLEGRQQRILEAFEKVLANALDFCENGDAIRIWVRSREERILVVIEDTGPGVPEESLVTIFERFFSQRPANSNKKHNGLGLAFVKKVVETHNGVVWCENIRPNDAEKSSSPLGARFVIGFPDKLGFSISNLNFDVEALQPLHELKLEQSRRDMRHITES